MFVKFRPGIKEFLKTMVKYFELFVYSAGEEEYVTKIVNIIDPDKYNYIIL